MNDKTHNPTGALTGDEKNPGEPSNERIKAGVIGLVVSLADLLDDLSPEWVDDEMVAAARRFGDRLEAFVADVEQHRAGR